MVENEFEMPMEREIRYFINLQINHFKEYTFINQAKYCKGLLKRFGSDKSKAISTLMGTFCNFDKDDRGNTI